VQPGAHHADEQRACGKRSDAARTEPGGRRREHRRDLVGRARESKPPRQSLHRLERQIARRRGSRRCIAGHRLRRESGRAELDHELSDRHSPRREVQTRARFGPRPDRHRYGLVNRCEPLEVRLQATHRVLRLGARQRIEPPQQQVDAMDDRNAGLSPAGEESVEVHRIAIAGNGGKPHLVGLGEGSAR
jgi:alkylhydroperoxidase family enzyme